MNKALILGTLLGLAPLFTGGVQAEPGKPGHSHDHASFSAGEPGDPKKPAKAVLVTMREKDGKMVFCGKANRSGFCCATAANWSTNSCSPRPMKT